MAVESPIIEEAKFLAWFVERVAARRGVDDAGRIGSEIGALYTKLMLEKAKKKPAEVEDEQPPKDDDAF